MSFCCFGAPPSFLFAFLFTFIPLSPFQIFLFFHPSIHPSIREGDFCSKMLQPSIIPHGIKKMPWHYVPGGHSIDFSSHVSPLPLFLLLLLLLLWLPLSARVCVSLPSRLPQRAGSLSDSLSVVPFHAAQWPALHYSANILHFFHTPAHSWMRTYIQADLFHPPIRLTALLKLPRT